MMALQGLLPDDEAMMNLAIALSLQEGVSEHAFKQKVDYFLCYLVLLCVFDLIHF